MIIVGGGPAGMFAALKLIEKNIKPVIIERGKDVRTRRIDLRAIMQEHNVNPDSNYCFGEGVLVHTVMANYTHVLPNEATLNEF